MAPALSPDVVGLSVLVTAPVLAGLVFLARPERKQNQLLALFLLLEGLHLGLGDVARVLGTPADLWAGHVTSGITAIPGLYVYLLFLATIPGRFSAPLASTWFQWSTGLLAAAWTLWAFVDPATAIRWPILQVIGTVVFLYGLLVALGFHQTTEPGTPSRAKARAYVAAFGLRDVVVAPALFVYASTTNEGLLLAFTWALTLVIPLFHAVLAYGVLRSQLFGIELKLKRTVRGSTMAAAFLAVFFAASEGAQVAFSGFAGNEFVGVGAAALLVFALAPLRRLAQRVSDAALPHVHDTEAYREARKAQVYRIQLEELFSDGRVTPKERRALLRLQESLGLDADEANRLEREVLDAAILQG